MNITAIWALMLNQRAKKDSDHVIECLKIRQGEVIVDVGSGGGYFSAKFAEKVGEEGKVFAVDTNKKLLFYVEKSMKKQHIYNVESVVGAEEGYYLPEENSDLIFMRNVFHHIKEPVFYFNNIKKNLKSGGRIAIVEWLLNKKGNYVSQAGHCSKEEEIQKVLYKAGFVQLKSYYFLKGQSFNIFKKV